MTWFRTVALAWLTAWMLVVPLVHVHPEVDHRHGDVGHTHGGIAHTVFSPDLSCEYEAHHDGASPEDAATSFEVIDPSTHALNHPEFGFVLALSGDDPFGKPAPIDTSKGSGTICAQHPPGRSGKWFLTPSANPPCLFLSANFSPRAPPFPSI